MKEEKEEGNGRKGEEEEEEDEGRVKEEGRGGGGGGRGRGPRCSLASLRTFFTVMVLSSLTTAVRCLHSSCLHNHPIIVITTLYT